MAGSHYHYGNKGTKLTITCKRLNASNGPCRTMFEGLVLTLLGTNMHRCACVLPVSVSFLCYTA